jgi:Flp pilus assembly protein TadG
MRDRGDDGFVGGFAGLLFGMLLFVAGTLLAAFAWAIVDTKSAATEAARQAARTYVEAPTATVAQTEADQAAYAALGGYGRDPAQARVQITTSDFLRCARVTVTVSYPAPLFDLPFVGRLGTGESVQAQHSELIDPYRAGVPGVATC